MPARNNDAVNDEGNDDVDIDTFVDVSAAKCQSVSHHSRVTSSCDVMALPASISDVDIDVINSAAVVCPGSHHRTLSH